MSQVQSAESLGKMLRLCSKWNNCESHINAVLKNAISSYLVLLNLGT